MILLHQLFVPSCNLLTSKNVLTNGWEPALPQVSHLPSLVLIFSLRIPPPEHPVSGKKLHKKNSYLREPTKLFKPSSHFSKDEPEVYELNFPSSPIEIQ